MLPVPTTTAFAGLTGAFATLILGVLTASWPAVTLGSVLIIALAYLLAATIPLGRRVRRHRLEFAWWLGHSDPGAGGGVVVPGKPFDVRCFLRHRGPMRLVGRRPVPLVAGGARVTGEMIEPLVLEPNSRTDFALRLVAPAAGRVVLHGLALTLEGPLGMFEIPLYFPNPLVVKVLPRAAHPTRVLPRTLAGVSVDPSGASLASPTGSGTELRELRALLPGDAFRSIAWKASARTGRLMVREVEHEVQATRYVIVDVSGTMRGGELGRRKLDFAVELAAAEARRTLDAGDRIGLLTLDGRILSHVTPRDGRPQLLKIFEALLDAAEVVDADLTDISDEEVARVVGRYVRQQDGLDFSRGGQRWDIPMLVRHIEGTLADVPDRQPIRADSAAGTILRRFCRSRGILLPYRTDPRDGVKSPGLAKALREAGGRSRAPMSMMVITDFDGMGALDPLLAAIKLLRLRGHALSFVVPDATTFAPEPRNDLERDLFTVYARSEQRRIQEARASLIPLGVPVLRVTGSDRPGVILARASSKVRRAA